MRNWYKILIALLSFLNFCIGCAILRAICPIRLCGQDYLNYMEVIVAVLALIVALLVAWQIWNTVDAKSKLNEIGKMKGYIRAYAKYLNVKANEGVLSPQDLLKQYIATLNMAISSDNEEVAGMVVDALNKMANDNNIFNVKHGIKESYKETLIRASTNFGLDVTKPLEQIADE